MKMFKILSPAYHRYGKNKNMLDRLPTCSACKTTYQGIHIVCAL